MTPIKRLEHYKQVRETCLDLTSPLPENELNGPVLDVNELIILSESVFFFTSRQYHTGKHV